MPDVTLVGKNIGKILRPPTSRCPMFGSKHPVCKDAVLAIPEAQQITPGFLCDVTLNYQAPPKAASKPEPGAVLPPDEYIEGVNDVEFSIEQHLNFGTSATEASGAIFASPIPPMLHGRFLGWTKNRPFAGYMSFKVGSVTESITNYFWSKPGSVSGVVGQRGGH